MFKTGHQKIGGRIKGTKNKKSLLSVNDLLLRITPSVKPPEVPFDVREGRTIVGGSMLAFVTSSKQKIGKFSDPGAKSCRC